MKIAAFSDGELTMSQLQIQHQIMDGKMLQLPIMDQTITTLIVDLETETDIILIETVVDMVPLLNLKLDLNFMSADFQIK